MHFFSTYKGRQATGCRPAFSDTDKSDKRKSAKKRSAQPFFRLFYMHPLFLAVGIWYSLKGELFLFLLSALVAVQHECAHAFAAARLGYKLNRIILMPFGALIDGDLHGISFKDEIFVAMWGPLCNLFTALFFVALWWLRPTMYAFTDTACYSSLSIALVNLIPAYPLDGGRILRCALSRFFAQSQPDWTKAERKAACICRIFTFTLAALSFAAFAVLCAKGAPNLSLLIFGGFLLFGGIGSREKSAVYQKLDVSCKDALERGVEIRRVAVLDSCPVKDALRFISRGCYLVLEVYDERENHLFDLPQNELSEWFLHAKTPYESLRELHAKGKTGRNSFNF